MNKPLNKPFFFLLLVIPLFSCVSNKKYREATLLKNHYKEQAETLDKVRQERDELSDRLFAQREKEDQYKEQIAQISSKLVDKTARLEETIKSLDNCQQTLTEVKVQNQAQNQQIAEQLAFTKTAYETQLVESTRLFYLLAEKRSLTDSLLFTFSEDEKRIQAYRKWKEETRIEMQKIKEELQKIFKRKNYVSVGWQRDSISLLIEINDPNFDIATGQWDGSRKKILRQIAELFNTYSGLHAEVNCRTNYTGDQQQGLLQKLQIAASAAEELEKSGVPLEQLKISANKIKDIIPIQGDEENMVTEETGSRIFILLSPAVNQLVEIMH